MDRERDSVLTEATEHRIRTLAEYGAATGADAILFIYSACGEAIAAASDAMPIPVLKPNETHVRGGLGDGGALGMLATFSPSVASMEDEFPEMADAVGQRATIQTFCMPGAMAALEAGDGAEHDRLVAEAAPRLADCDAVLLAHSRPRVPLRR